MNSNKRLLSITDKLVLSAYELGTKGKHNFSAEDLVVAASRKFPNAYGLAGYYDQNGHLLYPNSNRVFAEIMGSKPIRKKGLLKKVGTKMYQLTVSGCEYARFLSGFSTETPTKKVALPRTVEQELKRLFSSKAFEKYKSKRLDDITFYDACAFWSISPRSSAIEFDGKIANLKKVIDSVRKVIKDNKASFEHSGYTFDANELDSLLQMHEKIMEKFQDEIKIIRKRIDERT